MCSGFWDVGRFSKLPYLGMKLGHWPKSQKLHIYSLSALMGRNWAYFYSMGSSFRENTGRFSTLPCVHSFYCRGRNCAYFHSTGSGFWDTGPFSKLPYLGMKPAHWPKFQKLQIHVYTLSTSGGRNWAYFRSMGSGFWETGQFSKLPYLAMNLAQKLHTYSLSAPRGQNWANFCRSHRHIYPGWASHLRQRTRKNQIMQTSWLSRLLEGW